MTLKERLDKDLKTSLKSGDKTRLQTIRSLRATILEFEKSGSGKILDEEEEIKILSTAAKRRKESIEQFRKGSREDLAQVEEAESKIIMSYLPKQLSKDEIRETIKRIAAEIGAVAKSDFGRLMSASIKELKGKAEGKIIKEIVENFLS
jgi:uncharacterized protein